MEKLGCSEQSEMKPGTSQVGLCGKRGLKFLKTDGICTGAAGQGCATALLLSHGPKNPEQWF